MTKVAVVTRTKDRPLFLRRAVESVSNQSFDDYVHVIVNDGGDRAELESIVDSYSEAIRGKIQVFHREFASNAPDTIFNESIDRVSSEYITLHDDDDTWHKDFLSNTVTHLEENVKLGGVVVRSDKVVEEVRDNMIVELSRQLWIPDLKVVSLYRQCIDNQLTPIAFLFRRRAYEDVGKFDSSLPVVGDWEFGIRLLKKYDVDFIDLGFSLANYHHRKFNPNAEGNTSFSNNDKHRYYTNLVMNRYLREELAKGQLGIGYIMSKLKYDEATLATRLKKLMPRFIIDKLKRRVQY